MILGYSAALAALSVGNQDWARFWNGVGDAGLLPAGLGIIMKGYERGQPALEVGAGLVLAKMIPGLSPENKSLSVLLGQMFIALGLSEDKDPHGRRGPVLQLHSPDAFLKDAVKATGHVMGEMGRLLSGKDIAKIWNENSWKQPASQHKIGAFLLVAAAALAIAPSEQTKALSPLAASVGYSVDSIGYIASGLEHLQKKSLLAGAAGLMVGGKIVSEVGKFAHVLTPEQALALLLAASGALGLYNALTIKEKKSR
ncbi:MAG: hypothetical protein ACK5O9_06755 [Holosporales bacterium]